MTRPAPSPPDSDTDEKPVYRSYFDLLEEKYGDGEGRAAPPELREAPSTADSDMGSTDSGPSPMLRPRRRRSGRGWLVVLAFVLAVGLALAAIFAGGPGPDSDSNSDVSAGDPAGAVSSIEELVEGAGEVPSPADSSVPAATTPPEASIVEEPEVAEARPEPREAELVESSPAVVPAQDASSASGLDPALRVEAPQVENPRPTSTVTPPSAPQQPQIDAGEEVARQSEPPPRPPSPPSATERPVRQPPARPAPSADEQMVVTESARVNPPINAGPLNPPRKIFAPQPTYPEGARQAAEEGTVVLRGQVTAQGDVRRAEVLRGASPTLDRAALEAFRTWQFAPASRDGLPVESSYRVAFHFSLEEPATVPPSASPAAPSPGGAPAGEGAGSIAGTAAGVVAEATPVETADSAAPLPFGGNFESPKRAYAPLPKYPESAWATGVSGDVVLMVVVNERGTIDDIEVLQGLPHGLTEAAVDRVQRWRFTPAKRDGEAVKVYHRLRLRFTP